MPTLFYNIVCDDVTFAPEIEEAGYPNGFGNVASKINYLDAYESQLLVLPKWNPDAPTTTWSKGSGYGSLPAGLKQRGPYEVYAYSGGLAAWVADIIVPNTAAWVTAKIGGSGAAADYTGTILLDYESWTVYSFNYDGAYGYFKTAAGLSDTSARREWEKVVTGLLTAQVLELRKLLPKAKIFSAYICKQSPYGFSDKYAGAGDYHLGSTTVDTGRTFRAEMLRQLFGKTPRYSLGGTAGWLLPILRLYDYVGTEWYPTIGMTTPGGGNTTIGSGAALATETINTLSAADTAYLLQNNADVLRQVAAEAGRPLVMLCIPYYPGSSAGGNLQITGINAIDAELYVQTAKAAGSLPAIWMSGGVPYTAADKQRCRDGLANVLPAMRRAFGI